MRTLRYRHDGQKGRSAMAIDISKAKWMFSKEEAYVIKWFNDNGFEGEIAKQYISKTKFIIRKGGIEDKFELVQGLKDIDIKSYMEQYKKSFDMLCELEKLRKQNTNN